MENNCHFIQYKISTKLDYFSIFTFWNTFFPSWYFLLFLPLILETSMSEVIFSLLRNKLHGKSSSSPSPPPYWQFCPDNNFAVSEIPPPPPLLNLLFGRRYDDAPQRENKRNKKVTEWPTASASSSGTEALLFIRRNNGRQAATIAKIECVLPSLLIHLAA